jgi:signal transduction histidine kinase/ligand-binding sensor domain-containing protein
VADAMVRRSVVALRTLLTLMLLARGSHAFALDPTLDISQYAHKSWKIREGFVQGYINAITQTADGYLWLGTEFGLVRFDGVQVVPWEPPAGQPLPDTYIRALLAAKDGTLWIGTFKGLVSWKNGKLTPHEKLAGFAVDSLFQDHNGKIWAGLLGTSTGRLCAIDNSASDVCYGQDGTFGRFVETIYEDSNGNLWIGSANGLWRWKPDPSRFYAMKNPPVGIPQSIVENNDAVSLITKTAIQRFVDGRFAAYPIQNRSGVEFTRLLRDRHGSLWVGSTNQGLTHIHQRKIDVFSQSDGLSGDFIGPIFEDREGNIWVATDGGLDRFRESAVATISKKQGLSSDTAWSVLAAKDGSIWVGTRNGLNVWRDGKIQAFDAANRNDLSSSLFQDRRGRIWITKLDVIGYMEHNEFIPVPGAPGGLITSIMEDSIGNLWFCHQERGLVRLSPSFEVQITPWSSLGHEDYASSAVASRSQDDLWLGFFRGGVLRLVNGQVRESYTSANGLGTGRVNYLSVDRSGTLWASTEKGFSQLLNGNFVTLTRTSGLPCDGVNWMIEDDSGAFWLSMPCGLVRLVRSELDDMLAAVKNGSTVKPNVPGLILDASDGLRSTSRPTGFHSQTAKSSDGKLWLITGDRLSVVNPRHIPVNKLAPPVRVERIITDRNAIDVLNSAGNNLHLPPRTRDVVIEYTALSLGVPEKIRFRYKLENRDPDWRNAGNIRLAPYGDLSPGHYRFRVTAANESGVWNEEGTFLDFTVDPAYYQTTWFRLSVAAAFLALLAGVYQLRLRHLARQYNIRLEERVNERTRIARELHDTLLQSFQGALLKFYAVGYQLPEGSAAKKSLDSVTEQVRSAIAEGRDALQGLRSSRVSSNDLAETMSALAKAIGDPLSQNVPDFRVQMEGTPQRLTPPVLDEIHQFANEALRNAFKHANATRIELEILYDRSQFRLRIRDDGKGIDPEVLRAGGRPGHYGLTGMHERAKQAGGKVSVWSEVNSGTEVELTIPAKIAYAKSPTRRWPTPW